MTHILLTEYLSNQDFVNIAVHNYQVSLANSVIEKINHSNQLIQKWVEEGRVMYGVTTGFGSFSTQAISSKEAKQLQKNIILSHAVSVGEPLPIPYVRAIMLMIVKNVASGYTGVSLATINRYIYYLNNQITPYVHKKGSVGYLSLEAFIGLTIIGEGKVYYENQVIDTKVLLEKLELEPIELGYKEGLSLISGTTSVTAIANLTLHDMNKGMLSADIIGALSLETSRGTLKAFDERLMNVRNHSQQGNTASNVRNILSSSQFAQENLNYRLQDALSIRCIPQLHGSCKQQIKNAMEIVHIETNSCTDNPIVFPVDDDGITISGCNPDSSYVGMAMDSACIAIVGAAKMSERRNNRLIDSNYSPYPSFMIRDSGTNSGLMIPQYTQAGLLNQMRSFAYPSTVDNTPTCNNQEDYVAMGYNAVLKSIELLEKFEYILAIELLSIYHSYQFIENTDRLSSTSRAVIAEFSKHFGFLEEDTLLHEQIEFIKEFITSGKLVALCKEHVQLMDI